MASKSKSRREKYSAEEFMKPKAKATKRSAKRNEVKSTGCPAGGIQEVIGSFQNQEISVSTDQLESSNSRAPVQLETYSRAPESRSSSEESETEAVDVESDDNSDLETMPRSKLRMTVRQIEVEAKLKLTPEQEARQAKADEADRKAAELVVGIPEARQAVVKKAEVAKQAIVRNEVVIVGTMRFMPPYEIAED